MPKCKVKQLIHFCPSPLPRQCSWTGDGGKLPMQTCGAVLKTESLAKPAENKEYPKLGKGALNGQQN